MDGSRRGRLVVVDEAVIASAEVSILMMVMGQALRVVNFREFMRDAAVGGMHVTSNPLAWTGSG